LAFPARFLKKSAAVSITPTFSRRPRLNSEKPQVERATWGTRLGVKLILLGRLGGVEASVQRLALLHRYREYMITRRYSNSWRAR